jgi:hypothetical protein
LIAKGAISAFIPNRKASHKDSPLDRAANDFLAVSAKFIAGGTGKKLKIQNRELNCLMWVGNYVLAITTQQPPFPALAQILYLLQNFLIFFVSIQKIVQTNSDNILADPFNGERF